MHICGMGSSEIACFAICQINLLSYAVTYLSKSYCVCVIKTKAILYSRCVLEQVYHAHDDKYVLFIYSCVRDKVYSIYSWVSYIYCYIRDNLIV